MKLQIKFKQIAIGKISKELNSIKVEK